MSPQLVILTSTTLGLIVAGCSPSTQKMAELSPKRSRGELTAELAKAALLELIRTNPKVFIGNPDPKILAQLPIEPNGGSKYIFGVFRVDLTHRHYQAEIGQDAPEVYLHDGTFTER